MEDEIDPIPDFDENFPTVFCTRGPIRGRRCLDYRETPYYSFVRVPYATCPTGAYRFRNLDRRQAPRWTVPIDCTMDIEGPSPAFLEEACLYCNIFTPQLAAERMMKEDELLPVMVFIPGDNPAIDYRTSLERYGPQYLMTEKVVLVVLSHRTGILGFAKVESPDLKVQVPGYAAHSDISVFFSWLSAEIRTFGGSPDNITAFGQGQGAALIADMLFETSTWPRVTRVIIQSINEDSVLRQDHINIHDYAIFSGVANANHTEAEVLDILRALPVDRLLAREKKYLRKTRLLQINFNFLRPMRPSGGGEGIEAVLIGFNSNEGILDKILRPRIDENLRIVDWLLRHIKLPDETFAGPTVRSTIVPEIKDYFFKDLPPTQERFMQLLSDLRHNIRTVATARLMPITLVPSASIYAYRFDVDGEMNLVKRTCGVTIIPGACFADELGYLFKIPGLPEPAPGSVEEATVRRMIRMWTNFARHGDPNPKPCEILGNLRWKTMNDDFFYRSKPMRCMNIGPRLELTGRIPELYRFCFWCNIWIDILKSRGLDRLDRLFWASR